VLGWMLFLSRARPADTRPEDLTVARGSLPLARSLPVSRPRAVAPPSRLRKSSPSRNPSNQAAPVTPR
jgi:hypothetical protein